MRPRNRLVIPTLVLLLAFIGAMLYAGWLHDQIPAKAEQQADDQSGANYLIGRIQRWASEDWIAAFTFVLTAATIGMWYVMWRTLLATKRTVTAQIDGQRGKLVFLSCERIIDINNKLVMHLEHSFQNIGSGRLMVKSFRRTVKAFRPSHSYVGTRLGNLPDPVQHHEEEIMIKTPIVIIENEVVQTRNPNIANLNALEQRRDLSTEEAGAIDGGKALFIQYEIIYETAFGDYRLNCAWWTQGGQRNETSTRITGKAYDSDVHLKGR